MAIARSPETDNLDMKRIMERFAGSSSIGPHGSPYALEIVQDQAYNNNRARLIEMGSIVHCEVFTRDHEFSRGVIAESLASPEDVRRRRAVVLIARDTTEDDRVAGMAFYRQVTVPFGDTQTAGVLYGGRYLYPEDRNQGIGGLMVQQAAALVRAAYMGYITSNRASVRSIQKAKVLVEGTHRPFEGDYEGDEQDIMAGLFVRVRRNRSVGIDWSTGVAHNYLDQPNLNAVIDTRSQATLALDNIMTEKLQMGPLDVVVGLGRLK